MATLQAADEETFSNSQWQNSIDSNHTKVSFGLKWEKSYILRYINKCLEMLKHFVFITFHSILDDQKLSPLVSEIRLENLLVFFFSSTHQFNGAHIFKVSNSAFLFLRLILITFYDSSGFRLESCTPAAFTYRFI